MIKEDRKESKAIGAFMMILGFSYIAYDYLHYNEILLPSENKVLFTIYKGWINSLKIALGIKAVVLIISVITMTFITPKLKREKRLRKKEGQIIYKVLIVIPAGVILIGFIDGMDMYNMYAYPAFVGMFLWCAGRGFVNYGLNNSEEDIFKKLPKADNDSNLLFQFSAEKGIIDMPLPQAGILTQGSQRSGKTASWGEPMIYQSIMKGFGAFIYDYKGSELALTKVAYNTYERIKSGDLPKKFDWELPEFVNISFTDPVSYTHLTLPTKA